MKKFLLIMAGLGGLLLNVCYSQSQVDSQSQSDSSQVFFDTYNQNLLSGFQKQQSSAQVYTLDAQITTICNSLITGGYQGGSTGFGADFGGIQPRSSIFLLYICRWANPKGSTDYFNHLFPLVVQLDQKEITKDVVLKLTDQATSDSLKDCFNTDLQTRYQQCPVTDFASAILRIVLSQQQLSLFTATLGGDGSVTTTPSTMKNYSPQRFFFKTFHTFPTELEFVFEQGYQGKTISKKQIIPEWVREQLSNDCGGFNAFSTDKSYRGEKISPICSAPESLSAYQQYLSQLNKNWNKKNIIFSTKIFDEGCFDPILSGQTNMYQCAYELGDPRLESNVLLNEYMMYKVMMGSLLGLYESKPDSINQITPCFIYKDIQGSSVTDKTSQFQSCFQLYDQDHKTSLKQSIGFYFQQKNAIIAQYFISVLSEKMHLFNKNHLWKLLGPASGNLKKLINIINQPVGKNVVNEKVPSSN